MKTFKDLVPGNYIYTGIKATDARQITKVETTPTDTLIISFWEINSVMNMQVEDKIEVNAQNANKYVTVRNRTGRFYFSSREAAIELRKQYLQKQIEQHYNVILERQKKITELQSQITELDYILNGIGF